MNAFYEHHKSSIEFGYRCFDRILAMMFLGVITRVRIKDPLSSALPAFAMCVLNLFIFAAAL